jgi:hypothetical protein
MKPEFLNLRRGTGDVPQNGKTILTYDDLTGWQLTSWCEYESWVEEDEDGNRATVIGYTSDGMYPTVWDGEQPSDWYSLEVED